MKESAMVEAPPASLVALAREMVGAEKVVEDLNLKLKEAKAQAEIAEKKLVDEMITQEVKAFKTEDMGGFRAQAVVYPNVTDREALNAFVKKKKLDWLFTIAVNGQKLKSYVKELMENGKKIPPGIEPYTATVIRHF